MKSTCLRALGLHTLTHSGSAYGEEGLQTELHAVLRGSRCPTPPFPFPLLPQRRAPVLPPRPYQRECQVQPLFKQALHRLTSLHRPSRRIRFPIVAPYRPYNYRDLLQPLSRLTSGEQNPMCTTTQHPPTITPSSKYHPLPARREQAEIKEDGQAHTEHDANHYLEEATPTQRRTLSALPFPLRIPRLL